MSDTAALDELRAVATRYTRAKRRADELSTERRDAVLAALAAGESVSEVARVGQLTREHVARIRDGTTSGRKNWRSHDDS